MIKPLLRAFLGIGNPVTLAKKPCKRLIKDAQVKETKHLDQEQWIFFLKTAELMAVESLLIQVLVLSRTLYPYLRNPKDNIYRTHRLQH